MAQFVQAMVGVHYIMRYPVPSSRSFAQPSILTERVIERHAIRRVL